MCRKNQLTVKHFLIQILSAYAFSGFGGHSFTKKKREERKEKMKKTREKANISGSEIEKEVKQKYQEKKRLPPFLS